MNFHRRRHIGTLWRQKQKLIVSVLALAFLLQLAMGSVAEAQFVSPSGKQHDPENPWSMALSFGADKFFGFYPILAGTYKLRKDFGIAFGSTVYQHLGSQGPLQGSIFSNPWILVHAGIHKEFFDGKLIVRPEVGFTNGQILSSGNDFFGTTQPYTVFDGWLTKLNSSYSGDLFEGTVDMAYVGYWRHEGPTVSSYLHAVAYGGVRVSKFISVGPYYESLWMTADHGGPTGGSAGASGLGLPDQQLFSWLGPAVRLKVPSLGMSVFVSGGVDLDNTLQNLNAHNTGIVAPNAQNGTTTQVCKGGAANCTYSHADYFKIVWTKTF